MTRCNPPLAWDDPIHDDLTEKWQRWSEGISDINLLKIPRCVKPSPSNDWSFELHHFSDASNKAYGCCSYLRSIDKGGNVHTALLLSKNRVFPNRPITIPRLELQAAVLATQADIVLRRELVIDLGVSIFWVDSKIVLGYIQNESKRFHVFVANRLSVIRRSTYPKQWKHVAGNENPADIISRGCNPNDFKINQWFTGPDFLCKPDFESEATDVIPDISDGEIS